MAVNFFYEMNLVKKFKNAVLNSKKLFPFQNFQQLGKLFFKNTYSVKMQ